MSRVDQWDKGFILHSRPFRETSLIAEIFTCQHGRVSVLFRGVKSASGRNQKARILQPFQALSVLWFGDKELKTGNKFEADGAGYFFTGAVLYSAMYLNELLLRLLFKEDSHPELFSRYEATLQQLHAVQLSDQMDSRQLELVLRMFEWYLLAALGYELVLDKDAHYADIQPELYYRYDHDAGFVATGKAMDPAFKQQQFVGRDLLAMANGKWDQQGALPTAKRLMRMALAPHLGDKPLQSRQLFKQPE